MTRTTYHRLALGTTAATVLFLVLAIGALGIIGDGGRPDRIYAIVLVVLAIGAVIARLRPRGMVLALLATALTQLTVTATALVAEVEGTRGASTVDIVGINAMYAGLFCLAGWLFRRADAPSPAASVEARA